MKTAPRKCAGNGERCLPALRINFIFCLFKDCEFQTWTSTPGSRLGWLILDRACVAPGLSIEGSDLPSKERGKWKCLLVVSSSLGDNSFFSCSWQKEAARPPLPPDSHAFWLGLVIGKTEAVSCPSVCLLFLQTLLAYVVPLENHP